MAVIGGGQTAGHKYVKRTGFPGNYVYWYKMPDGSIRPGDESQQRKGKKEHAHRLVSGAKDEHHKLSSKEIAERTGVDHGHVKNLESNAKSHEKNGRDSHDFDDKELKAAASDSAGERSEKLKEEVDKRAANKVNLEKKSEELENRIKEIENKAKGSTSNPTKKDKKEPAAKKEAKESSKETKSRLRASVTPPISPELQAKIKRLGKGKGRKVELAKDELTTLLKSGKYALVSAGRNPAHEEDKKLSDEAITERYGNLEKDLVGAGYAYSPVEGHYEGAEDSFLVMIHDADRDEVRDIGEKYNQDSVIYGEGGKQEMHFTVGASKDQHHAGEGFEEVPDAKDFYTVMKHPDGTETKFSLGFDFDNLHKIPDADIGKPSNNMLPPPKENEAFIKEGKDVTKEDVTRFVEAFEDDIKELSETIGDGLRKAGADKFASRLKDEESLLEKMNKRKPDQSLNSMTDVIGARGLAGSLKDQKNLLKHMEENYEIVEKEDFSDKARGDGYRAIHVLFRTPGGKVAEMQLKTHRQQLFSGYTHDKIYKGDPKIKNDPEVGKYTTALSEYLYGLDKGGKDDEKQRPVEPAILKENGITFPWKDLATAEMSKAESKVKWYATIRNKKKENEDVVEFNSFDEAKAFKDNHREGGHKGEIPIGHSTSKEEYVKTFSEYRPTSTGKRGGKFTTTKAGKKSYIKKSFVLTINKSESVFQTDEERLGFELKKSFMIPSGLGRGEKISLIKGILIGRKHRNS